MTKPAESTAPAPGPRRRDGLGRRAYALLVSPKLAIALLVVVLACCVVGVTVVRGESAGRLIFATLWFNSLLVLLAVSSASAFFSRFWKRKRTLASVGMIVFHVSFLGVLGGVVLNGLFSFRGTLRVTEGETVGVADPAAYDEHEYGRFFDPAWLRGEITLVKMHLNYKVGGDNKRAAYELELRDGATRDHRVIYVTEYLDFDGFRFFCLKEGYSVLVVLSEPSGRETFGAHVPLQSIRQTDGSYLYASGSAAAPGAFPFPPVKPRVALEVNYWPGLVERTGKVRLQASPAGAGGQAGQVGEPQARMVPVGEEAELAGVRLGAREIRYWVGLSVRYDPGLNVIMASLTLALVGMVLTFAGRIRQGGARRKAGPASGADAGPGPQGEDR
jgi:cytochrome c biogenesis protein ResB